MIFNPAQFAERAAILEYGPTLYISFTSHCDERPYTGWIMAYNSRTLQQTTVLDVTPNGDEGAIWMSGEGLSADSSGNIYFLDGNGIFDTTLNSQGFPIKGDYGNAFMKLSNSTGTLTVVDYFTMYNTVQESDNDEDLGSGGAIVLPDIMDNNGGVHHLAVGAGKDSNIYIVNRDNMGKFNPDNDSAIYQESRRGAARRRVVESGILQRGGLLRRSDGHAEGVSILQRQAGDQSEFAKSGELHLSGNDADGLRQSNVECDCMGGHEQQSGGVVCLRRDQSGRTSCTTAIRLDRAISSAPAISSSRR